MANKGYRVVKVTVAGNKVVCEPDPANCYWKTGPDCIRWVFPDPPQRAVAAAIRWERPGPPYKDEAMFEATGTEESTVGSPIPDIVTFKNRAVKGTYKYTVILFDKDGDVVAQIDPDAQNDPQPPN